MKIFEKIYWDINERYYSIEKTLHELKSLNLEITGACNLSCKHCYMNSNAKTKNDLNTKEWKIFIKQIHADFGNKVKIGITGGEPLLRNDIVEIFSHLKKLDFNFSFATNGTLLNDTIIKIIKDFNLPLSISLDGFENSHNYLKGSNVFEKTLENIKLCKIYNLKHIMIKTAVYKKNVKELNNFYKLIDDLNVFSWHIFPVEPLGRGELNKKDILSKKEYLYLCEFIDELKQTKNRKVEILFGEEGSNSMYKKTCDYCKYKLCNAGISTCSILSNGDIVSCVQSNRNIVEGNIIKDNFKEVWDTKFVENRKKEYKTCRKHYF